MSWLSTVLLSPHHCHHLEGVPSAKAPKENKRLITLSIPSIQDSNVLPLQLILFFI